MIDSLPVFPNRLRACVMTLVTFAATMPAGAQAQTPWEATKEHELLKQGVGKWDATITVWPMPDADPVTSQGTETNELLPGGLWVVSRFEGELMGTAFEGIGISGYDPAEKKYVGTWADNMSPYLMTSKGDYDPATKTLTSIAESRNPETGELIKYKEIAKSIDDGTRLFELYVPGEDGQYWKMLEIKYKRRSE
jgi:Protein of unknown function (DUF1579)